MLDTDVIVAAMRSPRGASADIVMAARRKFVTLLASVPLCVEYEAICGKPEHRLAGGLSERQADIFITAVIAMAEPVAAHFLWRPQLRDPNDEMVLETAINGGADALVTFNRQDYGIVPSRFGVDVLLPKEALLRIKK